MAFWTYILRCADGSYYTGHTDDLDHRMAQHAVGQGGGYTSSRMPVELAWSSEFATRYEALSAERQLKGWSKAKKEELIRGDWAAIQRLARRRQSFETARPSSSPPQDERRDESIFPQTAHAEEGLKTKSEDPSRSTNENSNPIIVLVRPQLGENIGKAARAMLNFGLTELRLVEPRDGWPNPAAGPAASGADVVLEKAKVFATTAEAVADCAHVYATTVRKRGVTKPVLTPEAAAREFHTQAGRSAILFGPERSGLETSDVALARTILTVPINPAFGSLNLAQAVILVAYEWSKGENLVQPTEEELLPPAPQAELEGLIDHFIRLLEPKGYFLPLSRREATLTTLRTILTKPGWNHLEVRTLRGVLSALERTEERLPR
jgi:tRNA/rRNA methyltransferase